jgi:hypothetical protein
LAQKIQGLELRIFDLFLSKEWSYKQ